MARYEFQRWVGSEDFERFGGAVRKAVRSNDEPAKRDAVAAIWPWLWTQWEDLPLPRLSELLTALGPLREGEAATDLRRAEGKYVDDVLWDQTLRDDPERALSAALETITRARSADVGWRVDRLAQRMNERKDPRLTSFFLHWLEAPPLRALSTRPMWTSVFDLLFSQGDPRCLPAFEAMVEAEFPAGKTMQKWMGEQLEDQLVLWRARPDVEALHNLNLPGAEGPLKALLDPIAGATGLLTGNEVVVAGGGVASPSAADFLESTESMKLPWREGGASVEGPMVPWSGWHTLQTDEAGKRVMAYAQPPAAMRWALEPGELVVRDEDGKLLWTHRGRWIDGAGIDPSGRWLAAVVGGDSIKLVDLDHGKTSTATLIDVEKPVPLGGREPCVVFDSATSLMLAIGIRPNRLLIFRVHFDPGSLSIEQVETMADLSVQTILNERGGKLPFYNQPKGTELVTPGLFYDGDKRLFVYGQLPTQRKDLALGLELNNEGAQILNAWLESAISNTRAAPGRFRFMEDGRIAARMMVQRLDRTVDERDAITIQIETAKREKVSDGDSLVPDPVAAIRQNRAPAPGSVDHVAVDHHTGIACIIDSALYWRNAGKTRKIAGKHNIASLLPDGERLANSDGRNFRLLSLGDSGKGTLVKAHKDTIRQLEAYDHNLALLSLADDGIMGWTREGERLVDLRHRQSPLYMARHPSKPLLASFDGRHAYLWETEHGNELCCVEITDPPTDVIALGWGLDQVTVIFAAASAGLLEWRSEASELEPILSFAEPLAAFVSVPQLGFMVVSNQQSEVKILHLDEGELSVAAEFGLASIARSLAVRPNGDVITSSVQLGAAGSVAVFRPSVLV